MSSSSSTWSESSQTSDSSSSSSSSSISSESSPWDDTWYSILWKPAPISQRALLQVDLRHSDAEMVRKLGPLAVDWGGTFIDDEGIKDVVPYKIVSFEDNEAVTYQFQSTANAVSWQNEMELRIRRVLTNIREEFLSIFPGYLDERHRSV